MNPSLPTSASERRVALIDDVRERPHPESWAAGIARHRVEKLAIGFARQGLAVDIYRARSPGEPVWEDIYTGVRIHRVMDRVPWSAQDQSDLSHLVMTFVDRIKCMATHVYPCDAVHAWGPYAGLVGLRLARLLQNAPFFLNMRGAGPTIIESDDPSAQQRNLAAIESLLALRADYLITTSEREQDELLDEHGAQVADKLYTVPLGVDCQTFRPSQKRQARKQFGLPEDGFIVLWGELLRPHGASVKDAAAFPQRMLDPAAHLLFMGAGMRPRDQPLSHSGGTSLVDLTNPGLDCMRTMCAAYAAADVMVMPPMAHIGMDLEPKDAMSSGTPVIALGCHPSDELASVIVDGITGYVLSHQDPEIVRQLLNELREQPQKRSAMSIAALLRARTFFTWERTATELLSLYSRARRSPTGSLRPHPLTLVVDSAHGDLVY